MAQAVDILSDIVREELPRMLEELEPTVAPVFEKIKRTAVGVKTQDGLGKAYQVIHIYATGQAGLFESADPLGPAMTTMAGNQAQLLAEGTASAGLDVFPAATEVPHTGEVKRTLSLHKVVGNYSVPVAWKTLEGLNAAQLGKIHRDLTAVAKNKILYEASSFFSHEVTNDAGYVNQVLGRISAVSEHGGTAWGDYMLIALDEEYGRVANFAKGQRVDIVAAYDTNNLKLRSGTADDGTDVRNYATSTANYVHLIVIDVDYLGKKITLRPVDGTTGALPDYTAGYRTGGGVCGEADDWIVMSNTTRYTGGSRPQFSWGINSWVKGSGQILGGADQESGLDLDLYSMFKSQVKAIDTSLTDNIINGYIGGYLDSYAGESMETIITTQGVQQQWLKQPGMYNNKQNYERTGKALSFKGGWSTIGYEFGGRKFEWIMSPMCLSKTLYGMKFAGDNIQRFGPPRIGGSNASMGPELEFLATMGGHTGVFKIAHADSGRSQALLEAPFWYYNLIAPRDPRGMKFTFPLSV